MLRNDGIYEIYQIKAQFLNLKDKKWFDHVTYHTIDIGEKDNFTASGTCWQKTGQFGVFSLKNARKGLKLAKQLMKKLPVPKGYEVELAIFKVSIIQNTIKI